MSRQRKQQVARSQAQPTIAPTPEPAAGESTEQAAQAILDSQYPKAKLRARVTREAGETWLVVERTIQASLPLGRVALGVATHRCAQGVLKTEAVRP